MATSYAELTTEKLHQLAAVVPSVIRQFADLLVKEGPVVSGLEYHRILRQWGGPQRQQDVDFLSELIRPTAAARFETSAFRDWVLWMLSEDAARVLPP